jgi:predicted Zn-ribbon and HTH transcriptional regulator
VLLEVQKAAAMAAGMANGAPATTTCSVARFSTATLAAKAAAARQDGAAIFATCHQYGSAYALATRLAHKYAFEVAAHLVNGTASSAAKGMTSNVARCAQRASAAMLEVCSDAPWCRDCGFGHACGVAMAARCWCWKLALRLWKRRQMISRH